MSNVLCYQLNSKINDFMKVIKLLLITALLGFYSHFALSSDDETLCQEGDNSCTFVLLSDANRANASQKSKLSSVNESRANEQLSPFSTFKVANSLIALDLGVIKSTEQTLTYDEHSYPKQAWWPSVWKLSSL